MLRHRFVVWMLSVGLMVPGAGVVSGQTTSTGSGQAASTGSGQAYPNKTIRIVAAGAGGGGDLITRLIAQWISVSLGQQVIVDNRGGAVIPAEIVSRAPPDGYTLLVQSGTLWIGPLLQNLPYDPVRDFSPITLATVSPNILVVHPSVAANSVKELIALAKARPGELNYSSTGTGAANHLSAELFKAMAGVNIVRIAYKTGAAQMIDLLGGQVQLTFGSTAQMTPHIKSGKLRALAVTSATASALAPGVPTVAASGLPGYESIAIFAMFAPAKTPEALITRLNQETVRVLHRADVKETLFNAAIEAVGSSPEQLSAAIKSDVAKWGKVIKDAGIRAD